MYLGYHFIILINSEVRR